VKWNLTQCLSQAAGIKRLEDLKATRRLTSQEKKVLAIAKSHYKAYGCRGTVKRSQSQLTVATPSSASPSTSETNMGLLDSLVEVVGNVVGGGRANNVGPVAAENPPGIVDDLLRVGGNILGAVLPGGAVAGPAIGAAVATLGDAPPAAINGRAIPLEAEPGLSPAQTYERAVGRRLPPSSKVRRLVNLVGVSAASSILGLTVPATAMIAVRPYRRRGISAASLRITRRTIRAVNSINQSLSKIKTRRR